MLLKNGREVISPILGDYYVGVHWVFAVIAIIIAALHCGGEACGLGSKPHPRPCLLSLSCSSCLGSLTVNKTTMMKNLQPRRSIPVLVNHSTKCGYHHKNPKSGHTLFPTKLLVLLDDAAAEGNEHLISWLPDGAAFKIHDADLFAARLLKRYFRQSRFKSFTRQLYLYGFVKVENEVGTFRHPQFLRDDINSCLSIDRTNARTHLSSIQDSLKSVRASLRESGDRRYMRNKLVREAKKGAEMAIDNKEEDAELLECTSSSSTTTSSSTAATTTSSSSVYYYRSDCASPTSMELATDHLQEATRSVVSPYSYYGDEEDILLLDGKIVSTMPETQDDWLALVEKNLMPVEEPYITTDAASLCSLFEPTPINEESSSVAIIAPRILSSIL